MPRTEILPTACHSEGLADILERVLDKGVVIAGDIKIKLCDIELLSIQIRLLVASVDKAREMGMTWWWEDARSPQAEPPHYVESPPPRPAGLPTPLPVDDYEQRRRRAEQVEQIIARQSLSQGPARATHGRGVEP